MHGLEEIPFPAFDLRQVIDPGIQRGQSDRPRAVVGLTDLSARKMLRRLGKDLMTVSIPLALFQDMEANAAGSFLDRPTWQALKEGA